MTVTRPSTIWQRDPIGVTAIGLAALTWLGVSADPAVAVVVLVMLGGLAVRWTSAPVLVAMVLLVMAMAVGASQRRADTLVIHALVDDPGGAVVLVGTVSDQPRLRPAPGRGWYAPFRPEQRAGATWRGPRLLLTGDDTEPPPVGSRVEVRGELLTEPVSLRGGPVAGVVRSRRLAVVDAPSAPMRWADAVRGRIHRVFDPIPGAGADLVVGFLIGDVDDLSPVTAEELRLAGLSHFVAVSGSNVAVFLMGWWIVTMPLALRASTRWAVGIVGLAFFVLVTRWEPSVVRASVMAALALVARRAGIAVSGLAVLGAAVTATLLVVPTFATSLGFQLSVAATLGLFVGLDGRSGGRLSAALRATVVAQAAVAPLLLATVGPVPLVAPLANLLAAPLVSLATMVGMVASATAVAPLAVLAARIADLVAFVGRLAAPFPMLGWAGLAVVAALAVAWRHRPVRPLIGVLGVLAGVWWLLALDPVTPGPWVAFLDVGQGDAAVVRGVRGETILVDGGPDPVLLAEALRRHGVRRVDLLVISHRHADHVVGLEAVVGRLPVGEVWHPVHREWGALGPVLEAVDGTGIPRRTPAAGETVRLGSIRLELLGPLRRYVSPNDESLVVRVEVAGVDVLFSGDIEVPAQAELGPLPSRVLKVPHQGGGTSDRGWLSASAGEISVVSVGENQFGHPVPWVLETLADAGSQVCRTDRGGDVVVRLVEPPVVVAGCDS